MVTVTVDGAIATIWSTFQDTTDLGIDIILANLFLKTDASIWKKRKESWSEDSKR